MGMDQHQDTPLATGIRTGSQTSTRRLLRCGHWLECVRTEIVLATPKRERPPLGAHHPPCPVCALCALDCAARARATVTRSHSCRSSRAKLALLGWAEILA